jgi:hypothetical protein
MKSNKIVTKCTCIVCLHTFCWRIISNMKSNLESFRFARSENACPFLPIYWCGKNKSWITRVFIYAKSSGTNLSNKMQSHCDWYQVGGRRAETCWQRAEKGTWPLLCMPLVHKCMLNCLGIAVFWYVRACCVVGSHQLILYLQGGLQRGGMFTVYCSTQRSSRGPVIFSACWHPPKVNPPVRPAPRPTQSPVEWVSGLFSGR